MLLYFTYIKKTLSAPYEKLIEILTKCAKEKDIPPELIKKIYDLERASVHQKFRNNETIIRIDVLKWLK